MVLTIFAKSSILDIWQGSEYPSVLLTKETGAYLHIRVLYSYFQYFCDFLSFSQIYMTQNNRKEKLALAKYSYCIFKYL